MSNRKYIVAFIEGKAAFTQEIPLERILPIGRKVSSNDNDFEWIYAMQSDIDDILDLKIGEHCYMSFNRDQSVPGVIRRIS